MSRFHQTKAWKPRVRRRIEMPRMTTWNRAGKSSWRSSYFDYLGAEQTGEGEETSPEKDKSFRTGYNLWTMSFSWAWVFLDADPLRMTLSLRPHSSSFPSTHPHKNSLSCTHRRKYLSSTSCPALPVQATIWDVGLMSFTCISLEWNSLSSIGNLHQFLFRHQTKNEYSRNPPQA